MTVFILSALGAALTMVGVVVCFVTLQKKKKELLKLDIIHKPKRLIALSQEAKIDDREQGEKAFTDHDGTLLHKVGPEVVFSAQDVSDQVKKEFHIEFGR